MHPTDRNFLKLQIENNLFVTGETCYYEFLVTGQAFDKLNYRYFWDVEFSQQTNCDIFISYGRSLSTADSTETVDIESQNRYQAEAESKRVYLTFTGLDGEDAPSFSVSVKLRSFLVNSSETDATEDDEDETSEDDDTVSESGAEISTTLE